jgi:hypothetical protein
MQKQKTSSRKIHASGEKLSPGTYKKAQENPPSGLKAKPSFLGTVTPAKGNKGALSQGLVAANKKSLG